MSNQPPSIDLHTNASKDRIQLIKRLPSTHITTKQWSVLHAVASCGSYARAATLLEISQPAVSYIIAKLEEQVGFSLLKIEGRKARITDHGLKLLNRSQALLQEAVDLESYVKDIQSKPVNKLRFSVHLQFPKFLLFAAIRPFLALKNVDLSLTQGDNLQIESALLDRTTDIAINTRVPLGYEGKLLFEIELIPVAHASHWMCLSNRQVNPLDLANENEIVIELPQVVDESAGTEQAVHKQPWVMQSASAALAAVCEGFGYGWFPAYQVDVSLRQGVLKRLAINQEKRMLRFYLLRSNNLFASQPVHDLSVLLSQAINDKFKCNT
ncbi:LysR family transcriptional regulator [Noviherbaspirillum malthae]|uniref:LysR family transcriptional regulator n=1 Tax=Noviherbaspirillum malthae TaxID=1260987 RepID=UPI0018904EAA|nr:LysR family transcriptional regulator [Noviherbaspirillum malthae]